ncbi:MAG: hypothetical protein JWR15_4287, partial [Prosthecobacter sp.]|nr:hypothetical protein [Prosthecobacter sp.]
MKPTQFLLLLAVLLASPAIAQTPAAPAVPATAPLPVLLTPAQTDHILKELEKVESQIGQGRGTVFGAAMAKFREGAASPTAAMALFLDCYKLEHFDRRDLKQADFMDWRNRREVILKDEDYKKALALQLEYLVLSIQAQDADDVKKMAPLVAGAQAFLGRAITAVQGSLVHSASGAVSDKESKGGGKGGGGGGGNAKPPSIDETLGKSVRDSEFARAYTLKDFMKKEEWEYEPLNVKGIYQKTIFPYYLEDKPTEVATQWDLFINTELALRKALMSETQYNEFAKEAGPRMQWDKYSYIVEKNVSPLKALDDMLKIIQTYKIHSDAYKCLKCFLTLVN